MAPRLRLTLAYLGGSFAGWQKQPYARTVQGELEQALAKLYQVRVRTQAAGRTDAGVHADGQVIHFDQPHPIPPQGVLAALNSTLPSEIRVLQACHVSQRFHARRSAVGKRYRYRLAWGPVLPPWEGLRRLWLPYAPNLEKLQEGLGAIAGVHDFCRFALTGHAGCGTRGTVRRLFMTKLLAGPHHADLVFEGDGFLRGMVRRLVGALLQVAKGRQPQSWLVALLDGQSQEPEAPTAPALGLTLEHVYYRKPKRWVP